MEFVNVRDQVELDKVIANGDVPVIVAGGDFYLKTDREVRVGESSQPRIETWGSSRPRIVTWGSSRPRIETWGSSQPRIEKWESSQVTGRIGKDSLVGVERHDASSVDLPGAVILRTPEEITGLDDWIDYYGLESTNKEFIVYKLVDGVLRSGRGTLYTIGKRVNCPDWSDAAQCGNGLHFSPSPSATHKYADGTRYLACRVRKNDTILLGDKIKAKSCKVLYEVDLDGEKIETAAKAAA